MNIYFEAHVADCTVHKMMAPMRPELEGRQGAARSTGVVYFAFLASNDSTAAAQLSSIEGAHPSAEPLGPHCNHPDGS